jgi:hypothetical protein
MASVSLKSSVDGVGHGEFPGGRAALSAFQAAPRKTIIAESSIHIIKPIRRCQSTKYKSILHLPDVNSKEQVGAPPQNRGRSRSK